MREASNAVVECQASISRNQRQKGPTSARTLRAVPALPQACHEFGGGDWIEDHVANVAANVRVFDLNRTRLTLGPTS